ncbi:MAG: VOC family protein [Bacteroidota bacterium]
MITKMTHTNVYVLDLDKALDFYTQVLGFEVRIDQVFGEYRWVTVGLKSNPELELVLSPITTQMFRDEETVASIKALVAKGAFSGPVLACEDIYATYEELKGKGVEFTKEPTEEFYKTEAVFKDNSGNWFSLGESKG